MRKKQIGQKRVLGACRIPQFIEGDTLVRAAAIEAEQQGVEHAPTGRVGLCLQQCAVIPVGMTETVLPEDQVVGVAAVLNLDCFDSPIQDCAGADLVLSPFSGPHNAERVVAQKRLVTLPGGSKTFVEAPERMIGLGLDQFTEPIEDATKGAAVYNRHAHSTLRPSAGNVIACNDSRLGDPSAERNKGICKSCKKLFAMLEMEGNHIIPWAEGRQDNPKRLPNAMQ